MVETILEVFKKLVFSGLLAHEIIHGLFALPFAYLLYKKTNSWKKFFAVILVTYLIDLDHLIDYFSFYGLKINLLKMMDNSYFELPHRAFIFFHAWEWILILGVLAWKKGWRSPYTFLFLGLIPHLIFDSTHVGSLRFYSVIFRAINSFSYLPK